jgi:diadenosine tetraphosphate (Ap4A) HIT family hydrolase
MLPFTLHPTLARDTREVVRLPLCRVLLMKDRRFPWLILVPEREPAREIHQLAPADRAALVEEIAQASEVLTRLFGPDKLNVGALGNIVSQLHVHLVARFAADPAWPGPVWGSGAAVPYPEGELEALREQLQRDESAFGLADLGPTSTPIAAAVRARWEVVRHFRRRSSCCTGASPAHAPAAARRRVAAARCAESPHPARLEVRRGRTWQRRSRGRRSEWLVKGSREYSSSVARPRLFGTERLRSQRK